MEGETIVLQDLFYFAQTDFKNGRMFGKLRSTGLRPRFMEKFKKSGVGLSEQIFDTD